MKTTVLIYSLLLAVFYMNVSHAQTGFAIGASGSYLYSYRNLVTEENASPVIKRQRDNREEALSSFQFTVDALYQFKNNLNLSSGIGFSNYGHQREYPDYTTGNQIGDEDFSPSNTNIDDVTTNYRLSVLSIPLMLGYRLPIGESKKHAVLFRLGVNNHFLLKGSANTTVEYENESSEKFTRSIRVKDNVYSLSACANIGYFYQLNRHNIGISLLGDYGLTPVNRDTNTIKQYPYFGGIGLSYFYSLK